MSIFDFLVNEYDLPFLIRPDLWKRFGEKPADKAYMSALVVAGVFQYNPHEYLLLSSKTYPGPLDAKLRVSRGRLRMDDEMWQNFDLSLYSQYLVKANLAGYITESLQTSICDSADDGAIKLGTIGIDIPPEYEDMFLAEFNRLNILDELEIDLCGKCSCIEPKERIGLPLISPVAMLHHIAVNNPITFESDVSPELKEIIMHELFEGQKKLRSMSREEKCLIVDEYVQDLVDEDKRHAKSRRRRLRQLKLQRQTK